MPSPSVLSPNGERRNLPPELVLEILAFALGQLCYDTVVVPDRVPDLNFLLAILHVSYAFRHCAIKLLGVIYRDSPIFDTQRQCLIHNPKHSVTVFRRLSKLAHTSPETFHEECTLELLENPVFRWPRSSVTHLSMHYLINIARANLVLLRSRDDLVENVFTEEDLRVALKHYGDIPEEVRVELTGTLLEEFVGRCNVWLRLRLIKAMFLHFRTICNVLAFTRPFWGRIADDLNFVSERFHSAAKVAFSEFDEITGGIRYIPPFITEAELKVTGFFEGMELANSITEAEDRYFHIKDGVSRFIYVMLSVQEREKYFHMTISPV
ncbi:hypothetical protein EVG20_g11363 [Dentipellis fragilis]|uniref:Uncharacterized protein n=1 Tax=Dentipellis fragilis TaxID=205917 RepID=A0A4Y9XL09_9AGAM|nr:hypothetical protein EVG20_g11363 [Dentipellis fragilis]